MCENIWTQHPTDKRDAKKDWRAHRLGEVAVTGELYPVIHRQRAATQRAQLRCPGRVPDRAGPIRHACDQRRARDATGGRGQPHVVRLRTAQGLALEMQGFGAVVGGRRTLVEEHTIMDALVARR